MGFEENSTNAFVLGLLTSVNVLDFIPSSTLFLHSDMVSDTNSILQELYSNNTIPYSNHVYNCQNIEMYSKKIRSPDSNVFKFSVEDEHGVEINLNGHSILFTLLLYKKDNFTEIFKQFIKLNMLKSNDIGADPSVDNNVSIS